MSEQERQERITETLSLLGRMTPADLAVNREDLFFRAGEASARARLAAMPAWRHRVWPAIAATLALVAAGLGYSVVNQQPEVEVVYIERPVANPHASRAANPAPLNERQEWPANEAAAEYARNPARRVPQSEIIHRQDWAALSDAFAQQLRLQQERGQNFHRAAMATADPSHEQSPAPPPREQARTYLELRDAMRKM